MNRFLKVIFSLLFLCAGNVQAQEIMASVQVDASQVDLSDKRVFRQMEVEFARFLNERKWTNDEFDYNEKIHCNIQIVLKPTDRIGFYSGNLIIQAARPVYNSSYITSTFFFNDDDFIFEYVESQPLDFSDNNFNSNLTSQLAFYAYMVLGMDYDSFERLGGTPFFQKAENVVQIARQSGVRGWDPAADASSRNRGVLVNSLLSAQMAPMRDIMYDYHRLGLDTFIEDPDNSRLTVLESLKSLKEVRKYNPSAVLLISFFDAKDDELESMFAKGDTGVRRQAFELLSALDPSNAEKYRTIIK